MGPAIVVLIALAAALVLGVWFAARSSLTLSPVTVYTFPPNPVTYEQVRCAAAGLKSPDAAIRAGATALLDNAARQVRDPAHEHVYLSWREPPAGTRDSWSDYGWPWPLVVLRERQQLVNVYEPDSGRGSSSLLLWPPRWFVIGTKVRHYDCSVLIYM